MLAVLDTFNQGMVILLFSSWLCVCVCVCVCLGSALLVRAPHLSSRPLQPYWTWWETRIKHLTGTRASWNGESYNHHTNTHRANSSKDIYTYVYTTLIDINRFNIHIHLHSHTHAHTQRLHLLTFCLPLTHIYIYIYMCIHTHTHTHIQDVLLAHPSHCNSLHAPTQPHYTSILWFSNAFTSPLPMCFLIGTARGSALCATRAKKTRRRRSN